MDVNGTRFHLLLGKEDWTPLIHGAPAEMRLCWDEERADVGLCPLLFRFPTPPGDRLPRPEDRRGAAQDRYGNWYWIAEDSAEIRFLSVDARDATHYWSAADLADCEPEVEAGDFRPVAPTTPMSLALSGLAVTEHHYLVVGVLRPPGLLIFDLHAGGPPMQVMWPEQVPFVPFDMAPAPGGGIWILDREGRRYWAMDRYFRVVTADQLQRELAPAKTEDFQPDSGPIRRSPARSFPTGIALDMASPLEGEHPIAIEALPDGTVLILESDPSRPYSVLYRYHFGQLLGRVSLESALEEFLEAEGDEDGDGVDSYPFALRGHDMAFVPDREADADLVLGTLYIVASDGNQSFAFRLMADRLTKVLGPDQAALSLELLPRYFPMRLFSGKALVAADGDVYYDLDEQWLSLVEHRRPRYRVTGLLETAAFDGREPDCVWHRLFLDACIPNGTEVRVDSRAANSVDLLNQMAWQSEPRLYRRSGGPELPYYQYADPGEAGEGDKGTWELLFQRARGRYLQLRLTLRGTGRATPRLFALRAYYPRFSYLKEYLPAAYQVDETSASFLERFLANVEGTYTVLEGRIAQVQTLFDVGSAPAEYLEWLASWFGVVLDPNWDEARRRLFLSHVIELFNQRGTLAGLVRSVRLATDPCPDDSLFEEDVLALSTGGGACTPRARMARRTVRIVERFLTRSAPGVVFGDPTQAVGPGVSTGISDWTPDQGAEPLHQEFRAYLREQYADITALNQAWGPGSDYPSFAAITFPPVNPANDAKAADWQLFLQTRLGFTYAVVEAADQKSYQEFLARRYQHVERLNNAYQLTGERAVATFDAIALPEEDDMPSSSPRLYDWIQFVSLVLPIRRYAHRFSVLVPTDPQNTPDEVSRQLDLVRRVVELEKPAHTDFEVAPYWALFRVGEVRLGLDTLLGEGSRFIAIVLGQTYLSQSYLEASHPWDVTKRVIADRDRLGAMPSL